MNKVFLIGRLVRDPELRYTNNNTAVASFSIAVNRPFTSQSGEREADFINISVWRKQAENVKNYLSQGSQVAIDGRIQTRTYDDQDGKKRYVTEIIADNVQFLDTKNSRNTNNDAGSNPSPYDFKNDQSAPTSRTTDISSDPYAAFGADIEINDEQLPF